MPDRESAAAWLASVLRAEMPLSEGALAVAPSAPERGASPVWCDASNVVVRLRVQGTDRDAVETARELPLVPLSRVKDQARAEAFVRAWCEAVRRALGALAKAPLPDPPPFGVADLGHPPTLAAILGRERLHTRDDFLAALLAPRLFGRYFTVSYAVAEAAVARVHDVLVEAPPLLQTPSLRLRALTTSWNDDPPPGPSRGGVRARHSGVVAGFELSILDEGVARDSKQQELEVVPADALGDLDRVEAGLRAWRDTLPAHAALFEPDEILHTMPHDLVSSAAFADARTVTREEFREAWAKRWYFAERLVRREAAAAARNKRPLGLRGR